MIEEIFESELRQLNGGEAVIQELWSEVNLVYGSPSRHYHNISHLDNMTEALLPIKTEIQDWQTVIFSLVYHDIIYNPLRKDNEAKSAELAYARLTRLNLAEPIKDKCKTQILATRDHQLSEDADTNYFTDADLVILGAGAENYLAYTTQIRREYSHFPDLLYKPGRRKVLNHFLEMDKIFKTKYFQEKYEAQARMNISLELQSLLA